MPDPFFTTAEAAELAGAPTGAIDKAIEEGIVEIRRAPAQKRGARARRLLSEKGVYYVAFLRRCDLRLSRKHKTVLWRWIKTSDRRRLLTARCTVAPGIEIKPGDIIRAVCDRVSRYARARARWIATDPAIKGGTPVLRGTRLSVYALAGRIEHGDTIDDVLGDNPDLAREAVEAALTYAKANPLVGRPAGRPWRV